MAEVQLQQGVFTKIFDGITSETIDADEYVVPDDYYIGRSDGGCLILKCEIDSAISSTSIVTYVIRHQPDPADSWTVDKPITFQRVAVGDTIETGSNWSNTRAAFGIVEEFPCIQLDNADKFRMHAKTPSAGAPTSMWVMLA